MSKVFSTIHSLDSKLWRCFLYIGMCPLYKRTNPTDPDKPENEVECCSAVAVRERKRERAWWNWKQKSKTQNYANAETSKVPVQLMKYNELFCPPPPHRCILHACVCVRIFVSRMETLSINEKHIREWKMSFCTVLLMALQMDEQRKREREGDRIYNQFSQLFPLKEQKRSTRRTRAQERRRKMGKTKLTKCVCDIRPIRPNTRRIRLLLLLFYEGFCV